jgi:toxin YoeB
MEVFYTKGAEEDRKYWEQQSLKIIERIDQLIADIQKHPFTGLGKPEPLKFQKSGFWSRRINKEHRLVYKVSDGRLYIAQCRYHYK